MENYCIIGDIAGQYDAFLALIAKMPKGKVISVGDMVDRGPKSREVLEWFMAGNGQCVLGNHESMLYYLLKPEFSPYSIIDCIRNGTKATFDTLLDKKEEVANWMEDQKIIIELGELILTHAPLCDNPQEYYRKFTDEKVDKLVWNRNVIDKYIPDVNVNVYGHNGTHSISNSGKSVCIDNTHNGQIMGLHYPSMETFTVDF